MTQQGIRLTSLTLSIAGTFDSDRGPYEPLHVDSGVRLPNTPKHNVFDKIGRVDGRMQLGWAVDSFYRGRASRRPRSRKRAALERPYAKFLSRWKPMHADFVLPNDAIRDPQSIVIEDNIRVPLVDDPLLSICLIDLPASSALCPLCSS